MKQDADSEEDIDSSDLIKLTSFNQTSSRSFTHSISVSDGSKSFPGGLITVRRTVYQVEEEIAIMEVPPVKSGKTAVQKASKFGGRLLKTLFETSPAEIVFTEHKQHSKDKQREQKEAALKSSSNKSSSSSGSGGKPYTVASASPPQYPGRKPTDPVELGGYEEPLCTPSHPLLRKNHRRQDTYDSFITPGIRAYPKPRDITVLEHSKYSDSPGRSSRTTSTETSSHSNNFESDFDISTDSTGDRTSRREKERSHQALIDRLHAEALKMKLEKAEDEMLKLRMEVHSPAHPQKPTDQQLDAYRQDSNSNQQSTSSVDKGDRNGISRINSFEDSTYYSDRRQQEQCGSAGRPEIAPLRSTLFVADGKDGVKAQQQDDSDREIPPGNWVDYQPELEILDDPDPMQVDNAWRSAQMYTFLQDAASVNTVRASASILNEERSEKMLTVAVHKRDPQKPKPHSRCQSRVQSPTHRHDQQEELQHQPFAQMQQDSRGVHSRPHSRNEVSSTAVVQQHQVHSIERSRSVDTVSSTSSTAQQQRHVMQRTQSVDSNSSSKSGHSPKSSGQSYVSSTRSRGNTTIAERISRTHNMMMSVQQSISTSTPQTETHRHPQPQAMSNPHDQLEPADLGSNLQAERVGYRRPQLQPMSHQLEFETYRQPQPVDQHLQPRQPLSMPQPEHFPRQPQSTPQPESYTRQQQSHLMFQQQQQEHLQQLEFDIRRQSQQQYREQQQSVSLQSFEQQRLSQQQQSQSAPVQHQQPDHQQHSKSLTFPSLPQLSLDLTPSYENDEGVSSPLQLSPTSSGLITPTSMAPPTAFQSDEERAAWQHQRTMERMYNARRNREALLLKQRGATPSR